MKVNPEIYQSYIEKLQTHLFEDATFEDILGNIDNSHRKKRFVTMYLIKDKRTFHHYYTKRTEWKLEGIFNQIVGTLLSKNDKRLTYFVSVLEITPDMLTKEVSSFRKREMMKDLFSYFLYQRKHELHKGENKRT